MTKREDELKERELSIRERELQIESRRIDALEKKNELSEEWLRLEWQKLEEKWRHEATPEESKPEPGKKRVEKKDVDAVKSEIPESIRGRLVFDEDGSIYSEKYLPPKMWRDLNKILVELDFEYSRDPDEKRGSWRRP